MRKPFQGVRNIILFNWHFYAAAIGVLLFLILLTPLVGKSLQPFFSITEAFLLASVALSLFASFWVYDLSSLYHLQWVEQHHSERLIVNISAGFDETSALLKEKFKSAEFVSLDFYDPAKHIEISIKRARKAYPPFPNTRQIETADLGLKAGSIDKVFVVLAAHEIRDELERTIFFKEIAKAIKPSGQIYITEHLRDLPNFLAYNIGFLHFYSKDAWLTSFTKANLTVRQEIKITPLVSTFILSKNGTAT